MFYFRQFPLNGSLEEFRVAIIFEYSEEIQNLTLKKINWKISHSTFFLSRPGWFILLCY